MVPLRKVPDNDTVKLMTQFYTNIYERKFDKAKAVHEPMLKMLKDEDGNPAAKAWAAFTVIANPD